MLKEVQDLIKRIETFLEGNKNFETVVDEQHISIHVLSRDGESNIYHGYELYLMEKVVSKLNHTLDFKIIKDDGTERFVVTTDANYNIMSFVNSTNKLMKNVCSDSDDVCTVFLCEKITEDSRGEFSILTGFTHGSWTRCDITKAELLYAAVFNLSITLNEQGFYWFQELIDMSNAFFDEIEK